MYGMINKAVEALIKETWGEATWLEICKDAEVDPLGFLTMEQYDDAITYRLVGSASKISGLPAEDILRVFGEFFIPFTEREGYGLLLKAAGSNLAEFLSNMDNMHSRINSTFTEATPPSFRVEKLGEGHLRLHYYSHRQGLAPLVEGLLTGLGKLFSTHVTTTLESSKASGADHDIFIVKYG